MELPASNASTEVSSVSQKERAKDEWASAPKNPSNWSSSRRWNCLITMTMANFISSMAATAFEPTLPSIMQDFHSSDAVLASLTISIYLLGYIIGPLFIAPVSELYGRAIVIWVPFPTLLISLAGCGASQDIGMLIFFRAVGGFPQVALILMANALVADLIPVQQRGLGMSIILSGPSIGPTIGPIIGGYVGDYLEWRWNFWIFLIGTGVVAVLAMVSYRETYGPLLKERWLAQSKSQAPSALKTPAERKAILKAGWTRPFKIFATSPVTILLTFTSGIANGYLILALTTLGTVFESVYGFSASQSGLAYLGMVVGLIISQCSAGPASDRFVRLMKARNHGESAPENRIPMLIVGSVILPAGFFLYGWSLQYRLPWIVPIVGSAIIAVGMMVSYMASQMYMVDCFTIHTVSATGGASVIRSIIGVVLPLAANPMYRTLGYGWGNSLLAFIALLNIAVALLLLRYGKYLRTRFRVRF